MTLALLLLVACEPAPEPPPAVDPAAAEAAAEAIYGAPPPSVGAAGPAPPSGADGGAQGGVQTGGAQLAPPVQPELKWEGIGNLHKSFFSTPDLVQQLSADLTGEVRSPAPVLIRYDSADFQGWIRYQLDPGALSRPVRVQGDVIALQDLAPITRGLARYRSAVSGRFDLRLESFKVEIESIRAGRACRFSLAGPPPPDGALISPCVDINGARQCGEPTPEGVRFPPAVAADIRACLDR